MTPIGHISVSFIASKIISKKYPIYLGYILVGGIIPDIDFLSYFFGHLNSFHRTYTHSIGFLMICLFIILLFNIYSKKLKIILLSFSIGFILHLLVDAGLDSNYSNGIGIPILWPLYDQYFYWFQYFIDDIQNVSSTSWENPLDFINSNVINILLVEVPFYIYAFYLFKKRKHE